MAPEERALPKLWDIGAPQTDLLTLVNAEVEGLLVRLARYDPATALSSRRVATWSGNIAKAMGRSPDDIVFAERCGLLHDVGKLLAPLSLLRQAGPLTADQWTRMQDHVRDGAELLSSIPVLAPYVEVVLAHHERFDGSGYPRSLAGEAIPLDARIVAVADAFDAMISGRPYREAIRPVPALEELARSRGSQFDPVVVDALIARIKPPRPGPSVARSPDDQ